MRFFRGKSKAVKKWRSRAMLIDLRKTTITIIHRENGLTDHEFDE
jgi:hypothetical protein